MELHTRKKQHGFESIPSLPLGCCESELGARRHQIASGRELLSPSLPPSVRYQTSEVAIIQTSALDAVLAAIQLMREAHMESHKTLQEQLSTINARLNHLHLGKESSHKSVNHSNTENREHNSSLAERCSPRDSVAVVQTASHKPPHSEHDSSPTVDLLAGKRSRKSFRETMRDDRETTRKSAVSAKSKSTVNVPNSSDSEEMAVEPSATQKKKANPIEDVEPQGLQCLAKIVFSGYFDALIASAVIGNSLLVGFQVNHDAENDEDFLPFFYLECLFIFIFTAELFLRLGATGKVFCIIGEQPYLWASFDTLLVLLSWVDLAMMVLNNDEGLPGPAASIAKILKLARMARIMRFLRMAKLLAKVRVIGTIIITSMSSLVWLFILLVTIMYLFAIYMTQGATEWMKSTEISDAKAEQVRETFGTVQHSMQTLFESVTGGVSWGEPNALAEEIGPMHSMVFSFFIFFFFFSVLNIVTGVYVDGAIQQAHNDRTMQEMQKEKEKLAGVKLLSEALQQIDTDDSGCISRVEWLEAMQSSAVRNVMELLEVDTSDAQKLFDLVDIDGDNALTIVEFVDGMQKLRGGASSIDVHVIMCRLNHLIFQIRHLFIDQDDHDKYTYKVTRDSSYNPRESSSQDIMATLTKGIMG